MTLTDFAALTPEQKERWTNEMGCDIHIYTEVINPKNNKTWIGCDVKTFGRDNKYEITPWYDGRDYTLFAQLAKGVRGEFPWGVPCKGLPDNTSEIVLKEHNGIEDYHSMTYMTLAELTTFCTKTQMELAASKEAKETLIYFHKEFMTFINKWMRWTKRYNDGKEDTKWMNDIRIIYWFDN